MDVQRRKASPILRLQRATWRWMEALHGVCRGLYSGVWLGILSRAQVNEVGTLFYVLSSPHLSETHNCGGLFPWEAAAFDTHFEGCTRVIVLGAGAGRECAALIDRGLDVDGFECNNGLRRAGASFFGRPFAQRCLRPMEMDRCPPLDTTFDGGIIGWGMYTLIQGRTLRITMLRDLRAACSQDAPLLVSFFVRTGSRRPFRIGAAVGAALRRFRGAEPLEYGDAMAPNYAHFFSEQEIEDELREGGWKLVFFDRRAYPHAVATAAPPD